MATPRVFVSSTCMDFQDTRRQLRQFIQGYGFEAVMSEFNDIFYDFETHVQDACKSEIERCNLFILIVGNQYGSIYYSERGGKEFPDSVTLQEFKKALELRMPKHIFIEKFVKHDYENYTRARAPKYADYFQKNDVPGTKVQEVKNRIRQDFDRKYSFSQPQHKYVFYFLDLIDDLPTGNAVITFETFEEIKDGLRKQWAGLMYEALEDTNSVPASELVSLGEKVGRIENHLKDLLTTKEGKTNEGKITFDVSKLSTEIDFENFENLKERIDNTIRGILFVDESGRMPRGEVSKKPDKKWAKNWMNSLRGIIKEYKWSTTIDFRDLFTGGMAASWWPDRCEISYRLVFEIREIYDGLDAEGKSGLLNTLVKRMQPLVKKPAAPPEGDIPF